MRNDFILILILGVLLRLVIGFTTFHPDLHSIHIAGWIISSGHPLDFYDYILTFPVGTPIRLAAFFNYPPAAYLYFGLTHFIYTHILQISLMNNYLIESAHDYGTFTFSLFILLFKLPYLIFDLGTAYFLVKFFDSPMQKRLALIFWMFNPINLHATWMMSQHDILAVFFTAWSLYLAKKKQFSYSALALGFGAAFKIYPLFFLIPLMLLAKTGIERVKIFLLGIIPYILFMLPYLPSKGFRQTALVASQTTKSLYAQIPVSGNESLLLFIVALGIFYFYLYYHKQNPIFLWLKNLVILFIFFIFTDAHPQWYIWLTPFLIVELILSNRKHVMLYLVLFIAYLGMLFCYDPSLQVNLFSPIFPQLLNLPSIWQILHIKADLTLVRSLMQSAFAAGAAYLIFFYFSKHEPEAV